MALVHKYMADQSNSELLNNLVIELGQDRMQTDKSSQHDRLKDGPEKVLVCAKIG
jgi:hypothetical protein